MTFTLRPATIDDAAALAHIHVAGWRASYEGLVDAAFLDSLDENARAQNWRDWLATGQTHALIAFAADNTPAGFISYGNLRTPPPGMSQIRPLYTAEIYAIYLLPAFWRQKLGSQLMAAAATDLRTRKHKSLCLWVMEGNKRAVSFYKKKGGQKCGTKQVEVGGKTLPEIAYGWRDSTPLL
ncbi:MAG: GNAT family N-acetyltransferase [Alphaproteobacteria bacterium]|nr:GNAT family N-acetyltransferase [Alphaproteobacteria bacterium]